MSQHRRRAVALLPFLASACVSTEKLLSMPYCEPVPLGLLERPGPPPEVPEAITAETAELVIWNIQTAYGEIALRLIELQLAVEAREEKNNDGF